MKSNPAVETTHVQAVYEGVQSKLYELFMGQQIHVGGVRSSLELAELAGIAAGQRGVELCCGSGATMRLLVRLFDVGFMVGVELASSPVERGRRAADAPGLSDRVRFIVGDATRTNLPDGEADFVWGEDAWCYVPDKPGLIAEACRLTRPGGTIAFTDWVEGPSGLSDEEADHVLQMMTFPGLETTDGYRALLEENGYEVGVAEDTARFGPSFALYAEMIRSQLGFDALEMFDFNRDVFEVIVEQLELMGRLGRDGKLIQARFVARKR